MSTVFDRISAKAEERGWRCRAVPWSRLGSLREAVESRFEAGLPEDKTLREYLRFVYEAPPDLSPRSIIIVAQEALPVLVSFGWRGGRVPVVIPPTYVGFVEKTMTVTAALGEWLAPEGYGVRRYRLPEKTLAVGSGLAEYGRNNICYVEGLGSYLELAVVVSDMPCDSDPWREPRVMARCSSCGLCERSCPTGAMADGRFLLHAEKCLTLHNESEAGFPAWIDPSWHNSLIGCMNCQEACPANARLAGRYDDLGAFTEAETALLLEGTPIERLSAETVAKLRTIDFAGDNYGLLGRNLSALLRTESTREADAGSPA